jgi:hypothetical protein
MRLRVRIDSSGRVRRCLALLLIVCTALAATGCDTEKTPKVVGQTKIAGDYQFAVDFSSTQGQNRWSYLQWDGHKYTGMTWDASNQLWRGGARDCVIGRTVMNPGADDAVIAWTAPKAGTVTVRGTMQHAMTSSDNDGVRAFIRERKGSSVSKVWPSADYQQLLPGFMADHVFKLVVKADDQLLFHVNHHGATARGDTSWNPRITYDYEPKFTLDQAELVMNPEDFQRMGINGPMDSSLAVVPGGKLIDFYHSANGTDIQKFQGDLARPAQVSVYAGNGHFTNPRHIDGKWWIENIYQSSDGGLLAFCHVEQGAPNTYGWWSGGLAYSADGGTTFQILGKTIAAYRRETTGTSGNIAGMPFVVKDGYFYVYYTESNVPAVARAPVAEVLDAAHRGTVTQWKKYYQGDWSQDGLTGAASTVIPPSPSNDYGTHGDAAYSTYLHRYLLAGGSGGSGRGVYLAFGDDPASFATPSWIQSGNANGVATLSPYESIVDADGTDNGVVGSTFYVYFAYFFAWNSQMGPEVKQPRQWVYRQKVTLNAAGFDKDTTVASAEYTDKQGENSMRYLEYDGTAYSELRWNDTEMRWQGAAQFTQLTSLGFHPDNNHDTVLAWTAPRDGTVRISAALNGISVATGKDADGVQVKILYESSPIWPSSGYQPVDAGTVQAFQPIDVLVRKGATVYFHVNQRGNSAYDATTWVPVMTYIRAGSPEPSRPGSG